MRTRTYSSSPIVEWIEVARPARDPLPDRALFHSAALKIKQEGSQENLRHDQRRDRVPRQSDDRFALLIRKQRWFSRANRHAMREDFDARQTGNRVDHQVPRADRAAAGKHDNIRLCQAAADGFFQHLGIIGNDVQ